MTNSSTKATEDATFAAAVHLFELAKPGADGVSAHAKALHILDTTGRAPEILSGPELPEEATRAWAWWEDLHLGRAQGYGLSPISWADLHAYFRLHRITASPWEIRLVRMIDRAYLQVFAPTPGE